MAGVRITKKDIERFTKGDCDVLAYELHKLTNWPMYTLHHGNPDQPGLHAFVVAPGKIAVDIEGARHVRHLVNKWRDLGAEGYVRGCWSLGGEAYKGSRRRARMLAPHLAAMVG